MKKQHVCAMFAETPSGYCEAPATHIYGGLYYCDKHIDEAIDCSPEWGRLYDDEGFEIDDHGFRIEDEI